MNKLYTRDEIEKFRNMFNNAVVIPNNNYITN